MWNSLSPSALRAQLREKALARLRISSGGLLTIKKVNDTFRVKAVGLVVGMFSRMLPAMGLRITPAKCRAILIFLTRCRKIHNSSGMPGLVKWLKAASVLLQQSIAGHRLEDPGTLGPRVSRNRQGIPRFVLAQDRSLIRSGCVNTIRFYLTLSNLYRVLEFKGSLKLETITAPPRACPSDLKDVYEFVTSPATLASFIKALDGLTKFNPREWLMTTETKPFVIVKSAPGTVGETGSHSVSTKPTVLLTQARALYLAGHGDNLARLMSWLGRGHHILTGKLVQLFTQLALTQIPLKLPSLTPRSIGKLGFKEEPAGKVRVFAMVTAWDHWALKPMHDAVFALLRRIPQDGTHDQLRPLSRLHGLSALWSLDLTAATDRLPLFLQRSLMTALFKDKMEMLGDLWGDLLVKRGYSYISKKYRVSGIVQYKTGQPMGALSSWSSLAITHHFLVQAAAWHSGVVPLGVWFTDYAIVGDDVVIGNTQVKDSYLLILSALGMPVNQNKSILSPMGAGLEFCKRTFFKGVDVSPVPVQEFISANLTLSGAIAYMQKYSLSVPELLRSLGYGYRVLGGLGKHVGQLNARVRSILFASMLPKLEDGSPVTDQDIGALLSMGNPLVKSEESAKEVLFLFLLALKSLVAFHLYKIEKVRIDLHGLVAQEMVDFQRVLRTRLLNAYLIQQATDYRDGKFSGNLTDPAKPIVWTGDVEFPVVLDGAKPGTAISMINLDVPIEVLMGFRDLMASFEEPMEELLQLMLQESLSRRSRLIKELKLELKAFKPSQESVLEGFRAAVKLLKLLTELMDINPVMDRRLASIPKSHGHHINEQLWHLYTMVINDVTQQNKLFERASLVTKIPVDARAKALVLKYLGKR